MREVDAEVEVLGFGDPGFEVGEMGGEGGEESQSVMGVSEDEVVVGVVESDGGEDAGGCPVE